MAVLWDALNDVGMLTIASCFYHWQLHCFMK